MQRKLYNVLVIIAFIALAVALQNLQRKNETLEKPLRAPSSHIVGPEEILNRSILDRSPLSFPAPTIPKGAIPFEFNGETHYWIPLANASRESAMVAR